MMEQKKICEEKYWKLCKGPDSFLSFELKLKKVQTLIVRNISASSFYSIKRLLETRPLFVEYKSEKNKYALSLFLNSLCEADKTLAFYENVKFDLFFIEKIEIQKTYLENGVLFYKQFISKDDIEAVKNEVTSFKNNKPKPETILRYDGERVFDRVENIVPYCSINLKNYLCGPQVFNMINSLYGKKSTLLKDKINYKPPGATGFVAHQDSAAGWQRYGERQISYALALESCTRENGALFFSFKNHKRGLLSPLKTPLDEEIVKSLNWIQLCCEPGDAIFFDSFLPHFSEANNSSQERRVAFLTFTDKKYEKECQSFFAEKRLRQPPLDERIVGGEYIRDSFGKLVLTNG